MYIIVKNNQVTGDLSVMLYDMLEKTPNLIE